ncbi:MAG: hypothetical protein QOJ64_1931, partial [Acidobacteriota bacterium]|nr:hypothetical protein [Acidobacteriota bacterium]
MPSPLTPKTSIVGVVLMRKLISLPTAITRSIFTRVTAFKRVRLILGVLIAVTILTVVIVVQAAPLLFWRTDGTAGQTWTGANWSNPASATGGTAWVSGDDAQFSANSTLTYVTATLFGNVKVDDGVTTTVTAAGTASAGAHTYDIGAGSLLTWISQNFTASGTSFIKNGAGTWNMGAITNGYTGGFTLNAGTVIVSGNNSLGAAALTVNAGTIQSSGTRAFGPTSLTIGGNFTFSGTGDATFGAPVGLGTSIRTITNNQSSGSLTFSGVISGGSGGGLAFSGNGTNILSNANNFTGGVTINAGILRAGSTTALGPAANATLTFGASSTGKFQLNGFDTTVIDLNTNATVGTPIIESGSATAGTDTFTVNTANTDTFGGVLQNGGTRLLALTKSGNGTLTLSNANTYTGPTTISAGTLKVNGSTAAGSAVTVASAGTIGGTGTVNGTVALNGKLSPGASPGTLNTGATSYNSGGTYVFEINNATGTKGADPGWDWNNVTGTLDIAATTGSPFTIDINGLNTGNTPGTVSNFDRHISYSWIIATASAGITNFAANKFILSTTNFTNNNSISGNISNGTFSISVVGNDLVLNYTGASDNYYSKSTGNLDLLSTWGTNTDGTGTAPTSFTLAGQIFNIRNRTSATIGANWTVSGTGSKVILGDPSVAAINFTVPSSFAFSGTIDIPAASAGSNTLTLQNSTIPTFGTLNAASTVNYNRSGAQTVSAATYGNLVISGSGTKTAAGSLSATTLGVSAGTFDQGGSADISTGAVTVAASAVWTNLGTGDLTLSGDVSNSGTINFNANGTTCGQTDDILIRSSSTGTQRTWSGAGTFSLTDVDVQDQKVPGGLTPPLQIIANSSTNSGNNTGWTFTNDAACTSGTYTWVGGLNADWQDPTSWSPVRPTAASASTSDTLIFNGSVTPSPIISNVPSQSVAKISLINTIDVTLNGSAVAPPDVLTISGGTASALDIQALSRLRLSGTNTLRVTLTNSSTGSVAGSVIFLGNAPHQLTAVSPSTVTFASGSIFTTDSTYSSSTNPFGTGADGNSSNNSIVFQSGADYFHNNGGSPFGNPGPVVVFQTGSKAVYLTATGFDASGRTYSILTIGQTDPSGIAVNASQSGTGNFQFDELNVESPDSGTSSLTYNGSGASAVIIKGSIFSDGIGAGGATNDTTLTAGTGGILINGGGIQELCGDSDRTTTFGSNATVASGVNFTLERNLIVTPTSSSTLIMSSGSTLTAGASPAGYIIGNLLKPVGGDTTFEVGTANGYSPASLLSVTGSGDFTIRANQAQIPNWNSTGKALQRYWSLTNGGGIVSAKVSFKYLNADVPSGTDLTKLKIIKDTNFAAPITFPEGSTDNVDESNFTATTANPVGTFSNWSAGEGNQTTLVKLGSFSSFSFNNGNLVKWQTGYEVDNVGFNVYRMSGGKLVRITPSLVAGSALLAGRTTLTAGLTYSWWDPKGLADSEYYVEDMDLNGTLTMHGPIKTEFGGNINSPNREQATLLSQIVALQSDTSRFVTGYPAGGQQSGVQQTNSVSPESATPQSEPETMIQTAPAPEAPQPAIKQRLYNKLQLLEKDDIPDPVPSQRTRETDGSNASAPTVTAPTPGDRLGPLSIANDEPIRKQRTIAAGSAVKIAVRQAGWYRVTQAELVAAGLNPNVSPGLLQLYADGNELPIIVRSNGSQFGSDGYIEFYGTGMDTPTTDTRTYWLIAGATPGRRINNSKGGAISAAGSEAFSTAGAPDTSTRAITDVPTGAFSYTVQRKDRVIYFNTLLNGDVDNFFGPVISKTAARQDVTLHNIDLTASNTATLSVSMRGLTMQAHKVRVVVNGYDLGLVEFAGVDSGRREFSIPSSYLVEGNNTVSLTATNGDADVSLMDTLRLTYWRSYRAENNSLTFTSSSPTPIIIDGFTTNDVRVFDISNPAAVSQVAAKVINNGSTYSVKVPGGLGYNRS